MKTIITVINILTAIVGVLPKVVDFIFRLLEMRQTDINEAEAAGVDSEIVDELKAATREEVITATAEQFHGSGSVIPEPIIRIIYEYVVLKFFKKPEAYSSKLDMAEKKGYIRSDNESEMEKAIKTYPQLFGEKG